MFSRHFVPPRPVAWFFFLLAFSTTVALGTWQVERLAWKQGLIAELAAAKTRAPLTILPTDEASLTQLQFARVALKGTWVPGTEFHLTPRYFRTKLGFTIIAPFKLADGRIVLVNRGWVPTAKKLAEIRPETRVSGPATITGMVRVGPERNRFTPENQPARNIWFGRDVAQMAAFATLKNTLPVMVDVIGEQDTGSLPIPSDGTVKMKNDHLGYLITWYGIALGILVIFATYHRRKV